MTLGRRNVIKTIDGGAAKISTSLMHYFSDTDVFEAEKDVNSDNTISSTQKTAAVAYLEEIRAAGHENSAKVIAKAGGRVVVTAVATAAAAIGVLCCVALLL